MSFFPRVQRPCPYKGDLSDIITDDVCRLCDRKIHDLNLLSESERIAFLASCSGEICISYSFLRPALAAAAAVSAFSMPTPAAAQDAMLEIEIIMVGGIVAENVEFVADPEAVPVTGMPVVYEDVAAESETDALTTDPAPDLGHAIEPE
jgi:hypothetical protein